MAINYMAPGAQFTQQFIQSDGQSGSKLEPGPVSNLRRRNPNFTGRSALIRRVAARLAEGPAAVVAMRGLGGIGKSTLALEYAHQGRESGRYAIAWWVRADSSVTISADLAALAAALGLDAAGDVERGHRELMRILARRDDWMLVFDNAHEPGMLTRFLPGSGHVLITSRQRGWTGVAMPMDIGVFDPDESVEFLTRRSGRDESATAALLAEELGQLPLALAQAAAYADTYGISLARYLELYREAAPRLLAAGLDSDEYPHSVATTWQLHVDQLRRVQPAAIELLRVCAFLASTTIPLDLLFAAPAQSPEPLGQVAANPVGRTETVGALVATSLIDRVEDDSIALHRLVQAVTRHELSDTERTRYLDAASAAVTQALPPEGYLPESWPAAELWTPHALAVAGHVAEAEPEAAGALYFHAALFLSQRGHYEQAEQVMGEVSRLPASDGDATDLGRLYMVALSSDIKDRRGDLAGAQRDMRAVREWVAARQESPEPGMVELLVECSSVERHLGNLVTARDDLKLADKIARACGLANLMMLVASNAALVANEIGDLASAEDAYLDVLKWRTEHFAPDDHRMGLTLSNLATIRLRLGKIAEAFEGYQAALPVLERRLGPDHPEVATVLQNMAVLYGLGGDLEQADRLTSRALDIRQTRLGRRTPEVADVLAVRARILLDRGQAPEARRLAEEAYRTFKECLGPEHPKTMGAALLIRAIEPTRRGSASK